MDLWEMRRQISSARQTLDNTDAIAESISHILSGRLRQIPKYIAANLKRELKDFNTHTNKWKEE